MRASLMIVPPRARPTRRSRCARTSHRGLEKRTPAHARRRFKRENGGFWRAQFCTEVAHPTRFERVAFAFGGQRSIQLSYGCVRVHLADWLEVGNGQTGAVWASSE